EVFHFVEAVRDRVGLRPIAQMPLARKVRRVAVFLKNSAIVGVSLRRKFSSPGTVTTESAERMGMRPVINEQRPAVQLAWPYQQVNMAPSLAIRSTFGVGWPRAAPPPE